MIRLIPAMLLAAAGFAQTFEVASVKPAAPGATVGIIRPLPGNRTYHGRNVSLRVMMTVAYTVTDRQISGGPDWVGSETYDLDAKADRPYSTPQLRVMLQRLLEERFQLKLRHETREMPIYALTVDKSGPKLTPHDAEDPDHPPFGPGPQGRGISGRNVAMDYFAFMLSRLLDRNVVDRTGLKGSYDLTLDYVRDPRPDAEGAASGPTIPQALREQLGLRLESARGPVEHIVIERAERPSAN